MRLRSRSKPSPYFCAGETGLGRRVPPAGFGGAHGDPFADARLQAFAHGEALAADVRRVQSERDAVPVDDAAVDARPEYVVLVGAVHQGRVRIVDGREVRAGNVDGDEVGALAGLQ